MAGDENTLDESTLRKHSVAIAGHQTSVTLENIFWDRLKTIARTRGTSLSVLIGEIDADREGNLSSTIRVFILKNHC